MFRTVRLFLLTFIVAIMIAIPVAHAQGRRGDANADEKEKPPPALQYTVAAFSTLILMVILCMPSRKRSMN